jgi:hypothetical protein
VSGRPGVLDGRTRTTVAVLSLLALALPSGARPESAGDAPTREQRAAELAREFSDPLTTLPQIVVHEAYVTEREDTEAETHRVTARLLVPRIPRFTLLPFVQLLRPSFSLVTVPTGRGRDTVTAFGDMSIFDLFVLPWGRERGFLAGVGPMLVFPTATDDRAGQGAWQAGPAFGAIYKGIPGILVGTLVQNPISFAYTSPDRRPVSTLLVQPILVAHLIGGFYARSSDATWTYDWRNDGVTLPVSAGLGYVFVRADRPAINVYVAGEWMAYSRDVPVVPRTTVRIGATVAFPDWRPW